MCLALVAQILVKGLSDQVVIGGFQIDAADMAAVEKMDRGGGVAWASGDPSAAA